MIVRLLCYCSCLKEYHIGPFILHFTVTNHYTAILLVFTLKATSLQYHIGSSVVQYRCEQNCA